MAADPEWAALASRNVAYLEHTGTDWGSGGGGSRGSREGAREVGAVSSSEGTPVIGSKYPDMEVPIGIKI